MGMMKLFKIKELFYIFIVAKVIRCMYLIHLNGQIILHINTNLIMVRTIKTPMCSFPYKPVKVESLELKSNYFNYPRAYFLTLATQRGGPSNLFSWVVGLIPNSRKKKNL